MLRLQPIFKIRVLYKSGYFHDFEVKSFSMTPNGYTWECPTCQNIPLKLGIEEIAAVWQISARRVIRFGKEKA